MGRRPRRPGAGELCALCVNVNHIRLGAYAVHPSTQPTIHSKPLTIPNPKKNRFFTHLAAAKETEATAALPLDGAAGAGVLKEVRPGC